MSGGGEIMSLWIRCCNIAHENNTVYYQGRRCPSCENLLVRGSWDGSIFCLGCKYVEILLEEAK